MVRRHVVAQPPSSRSPPSSASWESGGTRPSALRARAAIRTATTSARRSRSRRSARSTCRRGRRSRPTRARRSQTREKDKDKDPGITPIDGEVLRVGRPRDGASAGSARPCSRRSATSSATIQLYLNVDHLHAERLRERPAAARRRRHRRRRGTGVLDQARRAVDPGDPAVDRHQGAAAAARQVARPDRRRAALPPALRRSRGQPRGPRGVHASARAIVRGIRAVPRRARASSRSRRR